MNNDQFTRKQFRARTILRALRSPRDYELCLIDGVLLVKLKAACLGYAIAEETAMRLFNLGVPADNNLKQHWF